MDARELEHIERAMWRIEDRDLNYNQNRRYKLLKQAQELWYMAKAKEDYELYLKKFNETGDKRFKKEADECRACFDKGEMNER